MDHRRTAGGGAAQPAAGLTAGKGRRQGVAGAYQAGQGRRGGACLCRHGVRAARGKGSGKGIGRRTAGKGGRDHKRRRLRGGACQLPRGGAAKGGRGKGVGRTANRRHGARAGLVPCRCTGKH